MTLIRLLEGGGMFRARPLIIADLIRLGVSVSVAGHRSAAFPHQQPGGGDTPGVAVAPVALAGAIIPGVARFIVMLSAHADVFGVGTTVIVGSMLVAASSVSEG
jgi:hypothetical protein